MFRKILTIVLTAFALHAAAAVEVNKANQAELESVKGIGPGLSTKILDARKTGQFKDWDDMVGRVSGIGPGNAARFSQAGLTVAGAGYDKPAAKTGQTERTPKDEKGKKAMTAREPRS